MNIEAITDLELAKLLGEQTEELGRVVNNVNLLKQELKKRMDKQSEISASAVKPE